MVTVCAESARAGMGCTVTNADGYVTARSAVSAAVVVEHRGELGSVVIRWKHIVNSPIHQSTSLKATSLIPGCLSLLSFMMALRALSSRGIRLGCGSCSGVCLIGRSAW